MYANLFESLRKKGISINAAASVMKMPESTFRKKVNDRCFSVEEAFLIKDNLFPEADMRYLFDIVPTQVNGNECEGGKEVKR